MFGHPHTSPHCPTLLRSVSVALPPLPQVRQQLPAGFIGLWPEFPLLSHSCVPNTATAVVGDRMLVHAASVSLSCGGSTPTPVIMGRFDD